MDTYDGWLLCKLDFPPTHGPDPNNVPCPSCDNITTHSFISGVVCLKYFHLAFLAAKHDNDNLANTIKSLRFHLLYSTSSYYDKLIFFSSLSLLLESDRDMLATGSKSLTGWW